VKVKRQVGNLVGTESDAPGSTFTPVNRSTARRWAERSESKTPSPYL